MDLKVGLVCDRGLNPRRPVNQDRYLSVPSRGLFAVFDGVGGHRAGEIASQTAAETVEETFAHHSAPSRPDLIRRAIEFANRDILELAASDPSFQSMATTVAMIHLNDLGATVAHLGDSRVYRFEKGQVHRETIDHTEQDDMIRIGRITPEQAAELPESHAINRALGIEAEVDVELNNLEVSDGTRFLLCTDGIYRHLPDQDIESILTLHRDAQEAADEISRVVRERGADDNYTAVVVDVLSGAPRRSTSNSATRPLSSNARLTRPLAGAAPVQARSTADLPGADPNRATQQIASSSTTDAISQPEGAGSELNPPGTRPLSADKHDAERQGNRIRVALEDVPDPVTGQSPYSKGEPSRTADGSPGGADNSTGAGPGSPALRIAIYSLVLLALAAGAYYAGYKRILLSAAPTANSASKPADQFQPIREAVQKGDYQSASAALNAILQKDPQSAEGHYWLGRVELEQRHFPQAAHSFEQALTISPGMHDAYVQAAAAYQAAGNPNRATELLVRYAEERRKQAPVE